jgi:hypothetical protein
VRRSQEPSARSGTSRTIGVGNGLTCTNPPSSKWSNGRRMGQRLRDHRLGFPAGFLIIPDCSESEIGQSGESVYDQNLTAQNKAQTVELGKGFSPAIPMRRRSKISIAAIIALLINSVCLCAATPVCSAPSCAAHEQDGNCPAHQGRHESSMGHACCQTAACKSSTANSTDADSYAANHTAPPVLVIGSLFHNLAEAVARLDPLAASHSPPSVVPIFLVIRALLL